MYYQLMVTEDDFRKWLYFEFYPHLNRQPKGKRWYESYVSYGERQIKWEEKNREMMMDFMDFYKRDFPDFYNNESWSPVNFGFTQGSYKTFYVVIKKVEDNETR